MLSKNKRGFKQIISAMMAAAITVTAAFTAVPVTAAAENAAEASEGIIDDTDGKFYAVEAVGATSAEWDGSIATAYAGGAGTASNPYQIANGQQLAYLAQQVDAGTDYSGVFFKLTADILLNDDVDDEPNAWNPIGINSYLFQGTFDGANHKVIGMYINDSSNGYRGLFGAVGSSGTVKNVGVTDGRMTCSGASVGGICGTNVGTISNCYNTIRITSGSSNNCYGGVCGYNKGTIENCYNKGELYITGGSSSSTKWYIGGVCGANDPNAIISGCYNTGRVYTTSNYVYVVGGVCGYNNCSTIKDSYNTGEVNGYYYTGGVCGENGSGTVKDSYNTGEVTGRYQYTGGVCGYSYSSNATDVILRCYNTGKVYGSYEYTGGICGYLDGYLIRLCYNKGTVGANDDYIGGICGYVNQGEIKECYNNGAVTMIGSYVDVGGIAGYLYSNCVLENSYNTGTVQGYNFVGGVWGNSNNSNTNTMTSCYNIGSVSGSSNVYPVGRSVGQISNVYYDSDVCTGSYSGNASWARTTEQLTAATALDDLGFDTAKWNKKANTSAYWYYPDIKGIDGDQPKVLAGAPVPTGLKATAGSRSVKLTWDSMEGAEKYTVYKYIDGVYTTLSTNVTATSYNVSRLTNGVKVGFKVKSYANGMWSDACDVVYATPKAPVPASVKAVAGNKKAVISWAKVSGATKYAVYKYDNGKYTCLNSAITGTSYTASGLTNNVEYGFKVKAYVDEWSAASALVKATPSGDMIIPKNLRIANGNGKVQVTWDKVSGATKYMVYSYLNGVYTTQTSSLTKNTFTVTGLKNGTKYGFKVKAFVGGEWSAASAIIYARPSASTAPGAIKAIAGNKSAQVKWSGVIGATKYAVYKYENGVYTCVNSNITDTSYTVTGLTNNKEYGFKVKAYVNGAWSAASVIAYATPTA